MRKFSTHRVELEEAFNSPYPARLTLHDKNNNPYYRCKFNIKDGGYVTVLIDSSTHADDDEEYQWRVSFVRNGKIEQTGEGDAMRIFSTVIKLVNDFMKKVKPKYVTLAAQKGRDTKVGTREKLYDRLIKRFYGSKYKVEKYQDSQETTWYLSK